MGDAPLVVVDVETTGLEPERHDVYEVALQKITDEGDLDSELYYWIEPESLVTASPAALQIGRIYERQQDMEKRCAAAIEIARFTTGAHLIGANPGFDAIFLRKFLLEWRVMPAWHYQMIDIESMAICGIPPGLRPCGLSDICAALGIEQEDDDKHTAKGDCDRTRKAFATLKGLNV